jgi:hypothetical protein
MIYIIHTKCGTGLIWLRTRFNGQVIMIAMNYHVPEQGIS